MAKRGFSIKKPVEGKMRRSAIIAWTCGALFAFGGYIGASHFIPVASNGPGLAYVQPTGSPTDFGIDPIITGSIGGRATGAVGPLSAQTRLDNLTMEVAALRELVAATQAATRSTNRRIEVLEQGQSFTTASIEPQAGVAGDQPLPDQIEPLTLADTPRPRVVLPASISADGGSVAISMRPLDLSTEAARGDDTTPTSDAVAVSDQQTEASTQGPAMVSQTPFAIDIGGADTLEGLDELWIERQASYGEMVANLSPRILLQQTSGGGLELRLVAGPFIDAADAAIMCAQLVAAGLDRCLPAVFDGQQLALR